MPLKRLKSSIIMFVFMLNDLGEYLFIVTAVGLLRWNRYYMLGVIGMLLGGINYNILTHGWWSNSRLVDSRLICVDRESTATRQLP